jgi:threonine/homoserine/homoserine lactone efflux protein
MHHLPLWAIVILSILAAGGVLYLAYIILSTWAEVKAQPREEMEWCPKHGAIRRSHAVNFAGVYYCSICFHENMVNAEKNRGFVGK